MREVGSIAPKTAYKEKTARGKPAGTSSFLLVFVYSDNPQPLLYEALFLS